MVRHIKGGHVAFAMNSGTEVTDEQIEQAKKNAGERFYCSGCGDWILRRSAWLKHREQCKGSSE